MTRINVGIHPRELPDKLLLAEHREITRIPNTVTSGRAKLRDLPKKFTLGAGHVKFFYSRLGYLSQRYTSLFVECRRRGFQVTDKSTAFEKTDETSGLFGEYVETPEDRQILMERIHLKGFSLLSKVESGEVL